MCRSTDYQNRGSLYGVGTLDSPSTSPGVTFSLSAGDIAVHAAGVAHRNVASSPDYEYVGVYPKGSPKWDNNFCKADPDTTKEITAKTEGVPVPAFDPVYGRGGPLVRLWSGAQK
ncbi:unnamed protein product [Zymoseptoria tritici ST99CH_3D7]|uniref:Cupin type-1 domain-containing protein n=1 Tax=Zymoseptoria tritici (strain ST99CH_3D7) TaxID=1276538 RepID=A0A1X7RCV8_ZYMT9|nr:unnamed protein product [Zymoseptoria tritici ST99CH_3D7]